MVYAAVTTCRAPPVAVFVAAGVLLGAVRPNPSAVPATASTSVPPAMTRGLRKNSRRGSGRLAWVSVVPCSRTMSPQRLSVYLVIALVLLPQPGPRPGQALSECDPGDAEGLGRLHRAEPGQIDELDRRPLDVGQLREPLHQRRALALGVDPPGELLDLVLVQQPVAAQPRDRVPPARRLLAVAGEHVGGDAEQPRPVRSPARVEPGEAIHGPDERLGGEIGDRLRLAAPAREVAHESVDVAPVHLLEFLERRARRPLARPGPHRGRPLPRRQCSRLSTHVP